LAGGCAWRAVVVVVVVVEPEDVAASASADPPRARAPRAMPYAESFLTERNMPRLLSSVRVEPGYTEDDRAAV
jgi:hypothetical protein